MKGLRLYKNEKLCSLTAIETLFSPAGRNRGGNNSVMAYPWRAVWRQDTVRDGGCRFLITVPKKRLRKAVDRVTMRRRMREAYRLNRHLLPGNKAIDIAFIYIAENPTCYKVSVKAVTKILTRISASAEGSTPAESDISLP